MNTFGLRVVTLGSGETVFLYGPVTAEIITILSVTVVDLLSANREALVEIT